VKTFIIAFACLLGASCPSPSPAPPPPDVTPDAGAGDTFDVACAHLRSANCEEGYRANCADVLRAAEAKHLVDYHVECLAKARNAFDVHQCGPEVACKVQ